MRLMGTQGTCAYPAEHMRKAATGRSASGRTPRTTRPPPHTAAQHTATPTNNPRSRETAGVHGLATRSL